MTKLANSSRQQKSANKFNFLCVTKNVDQAHPPFPSLKALYSAQLHGFIHHVFDTTFKFDLAMLKYIDSVFSKTKNCRKNLWAEILQYSVDTKLVLED